MPNKNNSAENPDAQDQKERQKRRRRASAALAAVVVSVAVGIFANPFEKNPKPPTSTEAIETPAPIPPAEQAEQLATNIRGRIVNTRTLENPSVRITEALQPGEIPVLVVAEVDLASPDTQSQATSPLLDRELVFAIGDDSAIERNTEGHAVGINLDPATAATTVEPIQSVPVNFVESHDSPENDQAGIAATVGLPEKLPPGQFVVVFTEKTAYFKDATGEHTVVSTKPIGVLLQTSAGNYALAGGGDLENVIDSAAPTIHES